MVFFPIFFFLPIIQCISISQIRLSYISLSNYSVSYHTDTFHNIPTVVEYVDSNGNFTSVNGTSSTYFAQSGYTHVGYMRVIPGTLYKYRVGDGENFSEWISFTPFNGNYPVRIAIYGDMGTTNSADTISLLNNLVDSNQIDLVVHPGDISYADDFPPELYEPTWNLFLDNLNYGRKVPYMVSPGNHESAYNFTAYLGRFQNMPFEQSKGESALFYGYTFGRVHFISISTEHDFSPNSTQSTWLFSHLSSLNSSQFDYVIIYGHRPAYCSNVFYCGNREKVRKWLDPILQDFQVNFYFAGHVHAMERNDPTVENAQNGSNENPKSCVHIVAGSPGCIETPQGCCGSFQNIPSYSKFRSLSYGIGLLTLFNQSSAMFDFLDSKGNRLDSTLYGNRRLTID